MKDVLPSLFQVAISGVPGAAYAVEFQGNHLRYDSSLEGFRNEQARKIRPAKESWQNFWTEVGELKIWRWSEHYASPSEGTLINGQQITWRVAIQFKDQQIVSVGANAFPSYHEEGDGTEKSLDDDRELFERFNKAVCRLIGGLPFRTRV